MLPHAPASSAAYADEELIKHLPGFTNHYAPVNGIRLHYVTGGSGPVLVCLPGWPQTWYSYHPIAAGLAQHYRVIIVDLRGMGSSDKPAAGYDKKTMAQDIYELLRHLGVAKASLLGHDIGGMVASSFAFNYPEATEKLIVADGAHPSEGLRYMPLLPAPGAFADKMDDQQPYVWWMAFNQVPGLPEQLLAAGGVNILPIYIEEKLAKEYYRKNPEKRKSIELGNKQVEFDKHFIDNEGLSAYFNRMYQDIDIYANNVALLGNQLLSPIAANAPTFYQYYISDTLKQHVPQLVELSFFPRTKGDMLFAGKLYVTLDGNYAVQQANLSVDKRINLNFVKSLNATLNFAENPDHRYHLSKTFLGIDFGVTDKGSGFYGERTVSFDKYVVNQTEPEAVYAGPSRVAVDSLAQRPARFLEQHRPDSLSQLERSIYKNVDTLQTIKSFQRTLSLFTFLFSGYKSFGPFEVGPANTFYSFNPVEGFRLRLGGRTTPEFSKRLYFETYAAYGFKDEQWKYFLSSTYSLNGKSIYTFPQNFIRASFQRDTRIPGQELQFVQEDNFLLSFKRGVNNRYLYNDVYRLDYIKEFANHFSYTLGFRKLQQSPAGGLYFRSRDQDGPHNVGTLTTSELSLTLRWAPKEAFYQGKLYRTPIINQFPIFTVRVAQGIKGFFNGEYNYTNLAANATKRFYLSQLGHSDVTLEAGYVAGQVPFPLLDIHRANQTYSYQLNSYNLMNFLEFSSDHYASLFIDHNFNGFFFNKLPLIKKLKLRETASLKLLYGGIRAENNPSAHPELYEFLRDAQGQPTSFVLGSQPYAEASVGVANIFKLFRLDIVKRLTYLDNPNVAEWGLRGRFKIDF